MMNFEEFTKNVADNIKDYLPEKYEGAEVVLQDVTKNNDTVLTGILIRTDESNIAPNIYLESFFEQFENGKSFEDIMADIADNRVKNEIEQNFDVSMITDLEKVKDKVICKLINAEMNTSYLADKPHTMVEDLAVTYAIDLGENVGGRMTSPITNSLMKKYDITTEQLHEIAMNNLANSQIEFRTMRDVLVEMLFPDGISPDDPRSFMLPPEEESPSMFVLTNGTKLNGATAILDSKTMENIAERLGGDFIVLPSSIHETIVLPLTPDMDRNALETMVQDVNAGQVAPQERLSDHVYMYDSKEKELVLADKMEERVKAREASKGEKKQDERSEARSSRRSKSMKERISEKKAEAAKNEQSREIVPAKKRETTLE